MYQAYLPNLPRLSDLPYEAKCTKLAAMLKLAFALPTLACDALGNERLARVARHEKSKRFDGDDPVRMPTMDGLKAYLRSDAAAKIMGMKWASPADNPILTGIANAMDQFYHELPAIDRAYDGLFAQIDMRGSNEDSFDLISSNMGITWERITSGGGLTPRRNITEAETKIRFLEYGAALGIKDHWIRFNKWYLIQDAVTEFQAKYWQLRADSHYGLFTALGSGIDTAFATDDQNTLNTAGAAVARALESKGNAIGNLQFSVLTNPERAGRILQILEARQGSAFVAMQNRQPIQWTVNQVIATTRIPANSSGYYLVVPGGRLKSAQWQDVQIESDRVPSEGATDWYGRAMWNAAIGDSAQVRRVLFS